MENLYKIDETKPRKKAGQTTINTLGCFRVSIIEEAGLMVLLYLFMSIVITALDSPFLMIVGERFQYVAWNLRTESSNIILAAFLYAITCSRVWREGCREMPLDDGEKIRKYLFLPILYALGVIAVRTVITYLIAEIAFLGFGIMPIKAFSINLLSPEAFLPTMLHYGYGLLARAGIFTIGGAGIVLAGVIRNGWVRRALAIISAVVMIAIKYFLFIAAFSGGFSGKTYVLREWADLRLALPLPYLWLLGLWALAAVSVWLSYKTCLRLYRRGYNNQRMFNLRKEKESWIKNQEQYGDDYGRKIAKPPFSYRKNGRIKGAAGTTMIVIAVLVILGVSSRLLIELSFGDDSERKVIDADMRGAEAYGQWFEVINGARKNAFLEPGRLKVFPDSVKAENVEYYRGRLKGKIGDNSSVINDEYRFLTQRLSDEDYRAEKERLGRINYTDDEMDEIRKILKAEATDEGGRGIEVYIAEISSRTEEYAICYDGENRIIYVFRTDSGVIHRYEGPGSAYLPKAEWELVPLEARNTAGGGFSIYQ